MASQNGIVFRVLGPLEAEVAGRPVALGSAKQRALLAALLLEAGRVVSLPTLEDVLWGSSPPATARHSIEVHVSRLRNALGDEARRILVTRPPGYLVEIGDGELDLARFEAFARAGRQALAAGDPERAADLLAEGLELWRGPALADVTFASPQRRDAQRLEQLRLSAVGDRIDADLALGRHVSVIAELEALVSAHPQHERHRAQLMLALYRSGRQGDALAVYRAVRVILSEQLGLEPGPELQQLERSILLQDPALDRSPAGARDAAGVAVTTCPYKGLAHFDAADAAFFCGRERDVDDVVVKLAEASFVGLVGASGSGKSSLLRAGVLPALAAGALPGSDRWVSRLLRPGAHPQQALREAFGDGLSRAGDGERIVIAVDQLEEVFTECTDESERRAFLSALCSAANTP
ncbi:MAG: hypothetical protein QOI03_496, partial [Solirubrobacteraceae bacterium]|nr:hypothetical protein [Solirubrobacteraceae bacterium]